MRVACTESLRMVAAFGYAERAARQAGRLDIMERARLAMWRWQVERFVLEELMGDLAR